jgi:hypothetical protein
MTAHEPETFSSRPRGASFRGKVVPPAGPGIGSSAQSGARLQIQRRIARPRRLACPRSSGSTPLFLRRLSPTGQERVHEAPHSPRLDRLRRQRHATVTARW